MKILLINPPNPVPFGEVPNKFKEMDIGCYPPLGLMYIASYLLTHTKYKVEIIDMVVENLDQDALSREIIKRRPDIVGIFVTSFTINICYEVCKTVKQTNEQIKTVLGGPHVSIYPLETLKLEGVDYVISGEGEISFIKLVECIENKLVPNDVAGTGYKVNGKPYINQGAKLIENLDSLSFPARKITPYHKYYSLIGKKSITTTIMTSRGCPYSCNFCYDQYQGKYRARSVKNVLEEIEECLKLGISEFFFFDEIFTLDRQRVLDFCEEIIKRNLKIVFDLRSRVDTIDEEMLEKLKQAGCERIQYGIESGSQEILDKMNKKISLEKTKSVVESTKKLGITTFLDFMLGYPGETEEQMKKTVDFAVELDPDFVQFSLTLLMPMTKIYFDALECGFLKTDFWKEVAQHPPKQIVPPLASEKFSREYLEKFSSSAYTKFYLRPRYILKRLRKMSSMEEFLRQVSGAWALVKEAISTR